MNVDPRVQQARELLAGTIRADHESEEARSTIHGLLALVDELQRWKADAADSMMGLQDLGRVLDVPLGQRITGAAGVEAATHLRDRAMAAEDECDQLRATVERVQALADAYDESWSPAGPWRGTDGMSEALTAILNGDPIRSDPTGD